MSIRPPEPARVAELERALRDEQEHGDQMRAELDQLIESRGLLEESRDHYADLYDSAPVADLTLDHVGTIREANLGAAELLGCEREKLIGLPLSRFVLEADRRQFVAALARARHAAKPLLREFRVKGQNGVPLSVQAIGRSTNGPNPTLRTLLLDARELARVGNEHQRLVEAERFAREANAAKDDFIAALSHELRTPLTPVLAAVSALSSGEIAPDQLASIYDLIRRNVSAEARLIDDLLDVTRITRGKLRLDVESADVHEIVREALGTLGERLEAKHHELVVALEARSHFTRCDPIRLRQVFWNLVGNAAKFTPDGGRIEIRSWNHGSELAVEVSDSGDGIEAPTLERIFAPFEQGERHTQASTGGLGLGLAICKGVVELHGGKIAASSPGPGKGSRFVVELSTIPAPDLAPAPPEPDTQTALELPKPRIFLIEDDADTSEALVLSLESAGYDVQTASNARQALEADLADVDLVVSDIGLPDMTGQDLLRALHKRRKVRAIALSGYGTERDIRASRSAGFVAHLTKPIDLNSLIAAIQKAMLTR